MRQCGPLAQSGQHEQPSARCGLGECQPSEWWSGEETKLEERLRHAPYLARQMSDFGLRKTQRGSNSGVCAKIPTNFDLKLTAPQPSRTELTQSRGGRLTHGFTQVQAAAKRKTLLLLLVDCLTRRFVDELVQW